MTSINATGLLQMRSAILNQNTALQKAAGHGAPSVDTSFGGTLVNALKQVNAQQSEASALSESYERGDTNDIVGVMVARQRAAVGFEATLQVRNKLLSAYRDIMNMPV
jgi:flagellar hook-basal body complex protein FliE